MSQTPPLQQALADASRAHRQGQIGLAERLYRSVLEAYPEQPDASHYLGLIAHQTGRGDLAERLLERSVAQAPDNPVFHYNYAGVLALSGRGQEAVPHYQRALELRPTDADAWHGLAGVLLTMGHEGDAIACWQRGLAAVPAHRASLCGIADAFRTLSLHADEIAACRRLYEVDRGSPESGTRLAEALADADRQDEALDVLDKLLEQRQKLPDAHCLKGVILSTRGRFPEAVREFELAIGQAEGFHEAMNHLVNIRKVSPAEPLAQPLIARARDKSWADLAEAVSVSFALGKIFEDAGSYDEAFGHYAQGNRLYRDSIEYSIDSQARYFERLKQCFGAGFQQRAVGSEAACMPIFIVGMPRSGTTLVEQILSSHREVHAGGELTALSGNIRSRIGSEFVRDMPGAVAALDDRAIAAIGASYLSHLRGLDGRAARITDKMPSNFMQVGLIHALFPGAAIIHCNRDPMDTCVSCYTNLFRNGQLFSYDLDELGRFYRLYAGMMDYWDALLPGRIHRVDYERLVADIEGESRRMLAHCGLDWDPGCLEFDSASNAVRTASVYQVRQPVYSTSVRRWRRYEKHLQPLIQALG